MREEVTLPLLEKLNEQWKETPPAAVSLALVTDWLIAYSGGKGRSRANVKKPTAEGETRAPNLIADVAGMGGVGVTKGKPQFSDPAGILKQMEGKPNG